MTKNGKREIFPCLVSGTLVPFATVMWLPKNRTYDVKRGEWGMVSCTKA